MRFSRLSALLVTAALASAPTGVALARPATVEQSTTAPTPATAATKATAEAPAPVTDAERYAAREAQDEDAVASFQGGDSVLVIGGSTAAFVLILILIVLVL